MVAFCVCVIVIGCMSYSDRSQVVSAHAISDKVDRRLLSVRDDDNPAIYAGNWGKEFFLATTEQFIISDQTSLYIFAKEVTTINVFAPYISLNKTMYISSELMEVLLDGKLMNRDNELTKKGIFVKADKPIAVFVMEEVSTIYGTEGYLALPKSALSTQYVIASDYSVTLVDATKSQFVIVAAENDTRVAVTFKMNQTININGMTYSSGQVYSQNMSKFDTLQLEHTHDLTGTLLQSNNPIAVFAGNGCGVGKEPIGNKTCQHEVEQLIPVDKLGTDYITVPLSPSYSYRYRIISPYDNTVVSAGIQNYTLKSGDFVERWETEPLYIHSSKPVMVVEYGECTYYLCAKGSDPSMITVPPISNYSVNFTFVLPHILTVNDTHNTIIVIVETNSADDLMLNNVRLNPKAKYTVTTSSEESYTILMANITSGYHKLHHRDVSVRFVAILYGSGHRASFGFPLGFSVAPATPDVIILPSSRNSFDIVLTKDAGYTTGYVVKGTPISGGNASLQIGTFPSGQNTTTHIFSTLDPPGTCFNFQIMALSGSEAQAGISEPVIRDNICYAPATPDVIILPSSRNSFDIVLTKGAGYTTGYVVQGTPISGGNASLQIGKFPSGQNTTTHIFSTLDPPGTCFNFQIMALSGSEAQAGISEPVIRDNICYAPATPDVIILPSSRNSFDVVLTKGAGYTTGYVVKGTPISGGNASLQIGKFPSGQNTHIFSTLDPPGTCFNFQIMALSGSDAQAGISEPVIRDNICYVAGAISRPVIRSEVQRLSTGGNQIVFHCDFEPSSFPSVRYKVTWYRNRIDAESQLISSSQTLYPSREKFRSLTLLTEANISLGITLFCTVSATILDMTVPSESYFAGFEVEVTTDTSNLNGKECHAICDPHMLTFDGRYYENQNEGTYILYKHLKKPVQVQMKTNPCYGFLNGPPFCPCGVAIAAGRDVFVVDRCSIPIKIYMPQCDDGTLKGKIKSDGNFYQIYLPTGSWVKLTTGISFNIYIYPSMSDHRDTYGLCGYMDFNLHNDFVLRNGTNVSENQFEFFNLNWLVKPEEDLFNTSNYKFLTTWPIKEYLCICGQYKNGHPGQSDNCSPESRKFCPESALNDSLAADCNRNLSTEGNVPLLLDPGDYDVSQSTNDSVMEIQTKINFTENSAKYECWSYLNSSLLFKKCSKIPDIDPETFVNTCSKDAMITKTMFWAPTHLDNAQKKCLYQLTVNQPIPIEKFEEYNVTSILNSAEQANNKTVDGISVYSPAFLEEVKDLACPMNCSNKGNCIKGKCICSEGFGGNDCSFGPDPPFVYGIPNIGVCDLHETRCDKISVLGNNFDESRNLVCRLSLFQVKANEIRFQDNNSIILKATLISFAEVSCPIVDVRSKRSIQFYDDLDTLAIGYRVAIGNTMEAFGRNVSLLIVDSLCVDCIKASFNITCTLKHGFDLIDRRCIKKMSAENKIEPDSSGATVLITSAVVGSVLVVTVVGVLLHYCLVVRSRRAKYEKEKRERTYEELQEMEKKQEYYGTVEEVYDEIKDLPGDYSTILDSVPTVDESRDSARSYMKLSNAQLNTSDGYSCLNKLSTNDCVSNTREHENKEQGASTGETNIRNQNRPLPGKGDNNCHDKPDEDVRL